MSYRVEVLPAAGRDLARLPAGVQERILAHLFALREDPRPPGSAGLAGKPAGRRKLRVGAYRVVYTVKDEALVVLVIAVGHRSRVYKQAERRE